MNIIDNGVEAVAFGQDSLLIVVNLFMVASI
ncbi:hypothetical protein DSUL_20441 [Desulfovibrionales bacterium]